MIQNWPSWRGKTAEKSTPEDETPDSETLSDAAHLLLDQAWIIQDNLFPTHPPSRAAWQPLWVRGWGRALP
ncbi:MAG: hypothetical protein R3D66_03250 [Alphaproteobacteria bacterium]